jgi:uncharacterized protein
MNGKIRIALLGMCSFILFGLAPVYAAEQRALPAAPAAQQAAPRAATPKVPVPSGSAAPSFSCAKASNAVERAVCADSALAELDVRVAAEYKKALALHTDKAALRDNQKQWLREMHRQCASAPAQCAHKFYRVRLDQLVQHNEQAASAR